MTVKTPHKAWPEKYKHTHKHKHILHLVTYHSLLLISFSDVESHTLTGSVNPRSLAVRDRGGLGLWRCPARERPEADRGMEGFLHTSTSEGRDRKEFLFCIFLNLFVLPKLPHDDQQKPDQGRKGKWWWVTFPSSSQVLCHEDSEAAIHTNLPAGAC